MGIEEGKEENVFFKLKNIVECWRFFRFVCKLFNLRNLIVVIEKRNFVIYWFYIVNFRI